MAAKQLVKLKRKHVAQEDLDDCGLEPFQVRALEWLMERGYEPAPFDEATEKFDWHPDPQVRAFQLIVAGKIGGRRNGAGRPRKPRSAEALAEFIRNDLTGRMQSALKRALAKDAGVKANLDAIRLSVDIERGERKLQIEEEEHEGNIGDTREELIATLISLVEDPATEAALKGSADEDSEVIEHNDLRAIEGPSNGNGNGADAYSGASTPGEAGRDGAAILVDRDGSDTGSAGGNGRAEATRDRRASPNPLTKTALRRTADRR